VRPKCAGSARCARATSAWAAGAIAYAGRRAASTRNYAELSGRQIMGPALTTVDFGIRYRFKVGPTAFGARLMATNLFDKRDWKVVGS